MAGMVVDPSSNALYFLEGSGNLYSINLSTYLTSYISNIGYSNVRGLALDTNTLYTVDTSTNQLISINLTSGASLAISNALSYTPYLITYDPVLDKLIAIVMISANSSKVLYIDKTTALEDIVGQIDSSPNSIALNYGNTPLDNELFGISHRRLLQNLHLPDYGGIKATKIPTPLRDASSITFNSNTGMFYSISN